MNTSVKDVQLEIKVENQDIEIKRENDIDNNLNPRHSDDSLSDHDNSYTSVPVKKEYDDEENDNFISKHNIFENDASIDIKKETVEDMNIHEEGYIEDNEDNYQSNKEENRHMDLKEETEHQNVIQENCGNYEKVLIVEPLAECKSETDFLEDPLVPVKDEIMPNTETPQDGSTSQAEEVADGTFGGTSRENVPKKNKIKRYLPTDPNTCEICEKKLGNKSSLTRHMLIHSGNKFYGCQECNKKFTDKRSLEVHMHLHTGERPFECKLCNKTYTVKRSYEVHMRRHTGEKPFECEICNKRYNEKRNLDVHMRVHRGERPYECKICKKSFVQRGTLIGHMRIHTGEEPYECEICKKKFSNKSNCGVHMRIHTGEKPYECKICNLKYNDKRNLNAHMRKHR